MADTKTPDGKTSFTFDSILIESERLTNPIECRNIVTDLNIYEHIDKPYLTAKLLLIDSEKILENVDFLGGEKITIQIKSTKPQTKMISNIFYVVDIPTVQKVNNDIQVLGFELIEDIAHFSNVQLICKSYSGKISEILTKISKNFLQSKPIKSNGNDRNKVKLIVPNLNPIQTLIWLKKTAKTIDGYPFFLYSTLAKKELQFFDLGTMLTTDVINGDVPFRTHTAQTNSMSNARNRNIIETRFSNTATLFDLITKSVVGAKYEYIDTTAEKTKTFHFDVIKDLFKPLINKSILKKGQDNPPVSPKFTYETKPFNELNGTYSTVIGGSNVYRTSDEDNYILGYSEERSLADYKLKVISRAMNEIIRSEPLIITVDGTDFIDGNKHSTIGNLINIEIPTSRPETVGSRIDKKKSGEYLMFSAKHVFKKERYDLTLTCVKLGRRRG